MGMTWKDNHIRYRKCKKKHGRYKTYNDALKAAKRIERRSGDKLYPYECSYCNGWHLSRSLWEDK